MSDKPRPTSLGERITFRREEKGWSQRELAIRAEVSHAVISRLENGTRADISLSMAKRIARVLGVGIDYLANTFNGGFDDPDDSPEGVLILADTTRLPVTTLITEVS